MRNQPPRFPPRIIRETALKARRRLSAFYRGLVHFSAGAFPAKHVFPPKNRPIPSRLGERQLNFSALCSSWR
ncbi:MAG: hypothetical protein KKE86_16115 [Planctomycetes bacterium]|nr:hypothetical protein [Planctomycetota bacterium]MBU4400841.1 hypothetical protein [Planctomycetota bacterium]MCG2682604.1 hypothetical protein [Planctomycetales bacterium]